MQNRIFSYLSFKALASFVLVAGMGAFAQAQKNRKPTAECTFDIKSIVVRSESAVEEDDAVNSKLVQVYPELTDFSSSIPNNIALKLQYVTDCKEPIVARVVSTPSFASGKLAAKPWFKRDSNLQQLKASGEAVLREIPVLKFYETLSPKTWAQSLTFDVTIIAGGREVAAKSVTMDSPLSGD